MPPKKRLMKQKSRNVKRKRSYTRRKNSSNPETDNCQTRLSFLPVDVLLYIYKYLSPMDIFALSQLGDKRLTESTFSFKEANLSSCRKATYLEVSSYFCRNRVESIQKLNFNYMFSLKPSDLMHIICRCKNLRELSVVHCGIKYSNFVKILKSCLFLQELSWNFNGDVPNQYESFRHSALSRLFFFNDFEASLCDLCDILIMFPNIKDVFVNAASDSLIASPWIGLWLQSYYVLTGEEKKYMLIFNSFQFFYSDDMLAYIREKVRKDYLTKRQIPSNLYGSYKYSPYLLIRTVKEDILSLSSCSYSSLTLILTSDITEVSEGLSECILKVAGPKLNHLSIENEGSIIFGGISVPPLRDEEILLACDMLNSLLPVCTNITVLNMVTVHFTIGSPFKAICYLKYLEVLTISTCAFFKSFNEEKFKDRWSKDQCCGFKEVVSSCPMVQDFHLNCCQDDVGKVKDEDLNPIKDWKKLKHLSVYSMIFTRCTFLKKIADCCSDFRSFSCISVFPSNSCTFYDSLKYLLKMAKNLSLIRINENRFNPVYEGFWRAVGQAKNLQGICIITDCNIYVDSMQIISNIKELEYLHLFHFYAKRVPNHLYAGVKKSMRENNIINVKVKRDCRILKVNDMSREMYYHQQPEFWCQHPHFKDIYQ